MEKRYIIHKYIMAQSATDALKKEGKQPVDAVFVDNDWLSEHDKEEIKLGFGKK